MCFILNPIIINSIIFQDESRVERFGRLCLFSEERVDWSFHSLRSSYNERWHLGFNKRRMLRVPGTKFRAATARRGGHADARSCEAQFHTGLQPPPVSLAGRYSGIFDLISELEAEDNTAAAEAPPAAEGRDGEAEEEERRAEVSKAHLEALQLQRSLTRGRVNRIRHLPHKRPRPSRQEKRLARGAERQPKGSQRRAVSKRNA